MAHGYRPTAYITDANSYPLRYTKHHADGKVEATTRSEIDADILTAY